MDSALEGGVASGRSGPSNLWVFPVLWDSPKRLFTEFIHYVSVTVLTSLHSLSCLTVRSPQTVILLCVCSLSRVQLFVTSWTVAHQAPRSMGLSLQDTGVGRHFLLQEIFRTQGSNLCLLGLLHGWVDSLPLHHLGSPLGYYYYSLLMDRETDDTVRDSKMKRGSALLGD